MEELFYFSLPLSPTPFTSAACDQALWMHTAQRAAVRKTMKLVSRVRS